jgi:hypothetical protein
MKSFKDLGGEVLEGIAKKIKEGVENVEKELPLLYAEILKIELVNNIVNLFFASMWIIISIWLGFVSYGLTKVTPPTLDHSFDLPVSWNCWWLGCIGAVVVIAVAFWNIVGNIKQICKLKIAPRVYVLEYLKDLMNKDED